MAIAYFLFLIALSFISLSSSQREVVDSSPATVAFVFAGSVRTFVFPYVKKTIKRNLIQSFCPAPQCKHDVFVRISTSDNNHVGISAKGNLTLGTPELRQQADEALKSITPLPEEGGQLHRVFVDIASEEEKREMLEAFPSDMKHKIYRDLDPRRYSMYFNRWKAYEMMVAHEKTLPKPYTWVIFGRLDTAWGAPISPYSTWLPDKIYAPEIWHADVPDTFAILPRFTAKIYFSMEDLMKPKVLCLGGPNLDVATLEPSYLTSIGYTGELLQAALQEDCRTMHPQHDKIKEKLTGLVWSTAGLSEFLLKRRLAQHKFVIQDGTIKLISVFMMIMRYPLEPLCLYCKTEFLVSWAKINNWPSAALYPSCYMMNDLVKKFEMDKSTNTCRARETNYILLDRPSQIKVLSEESCMLKEEITDLNFLPFRMRSKHRCLTTSRERQPLEGDLTMQLCINYKRKRFLETYVENQVYHVFPLLKTPQKVIQYTRFPNEQRLCLTVLPNQKITFPMTASDEDLKKNEIPVGFRHCTLTSDRDFKGNQMFTIDMHDSPRLNRAAVNIESKTYNKPLTLISIRWTWQHPSTSKQYDYCLSFPSGNSTGSALKLITCENRLADINSLNNRQTDISTMILERVVLAGPPLRPGIMIGKQPAWSDQY